MTSLPVRDGPAAQLARLMHERGMTARIRPLGDLLILTIRNPSVPGARLSQCVAFVPNAKGGRFAWLFEGKGRNTFDTETIGPASEVEAVADRIARVLSLAEQSDAC